MSASTARVHGTTHERPSERREQEPLAPLPQAFAWERFATEERKVGWDGYLSYDGVLYGLPSSPPLGRCRGPGAGAAWDARGVVGGPSHGGTGQAPPVPDACRAPGPISQRGSRCLAPGAKRSPGPSAARPRGADAAAVRV